jgi:CHAT domain-containing protein/Tfp pilus assembly protein PilF
MRYILFLIFIPIVIFGQRKANISYEEVKELESNATEYFKNGKFEDALNIGLKIISLTEGTNLDSISITWVGNSAILFRNLGRFDEAETFYLRAVKDFKKVYGDKHERNAAPLNNLALFYLNREKFQQAIPIFLEVKSIFKDLIGVKHPNYPKFLHNFGALYVEIGDYVKAEEILLESLKLRKESLGEQHPDYAQSLQALAGVYSKKGSLDEAEKLYQQALAIRKKVLGEDHAHTLMTKNNLAQLYQKKKGFSNSEKYFLEVFESDSAQNYPNKVKSAITLNGIAKMYRTKGEGDKALFYLKKAIILNSKEKFNSDELPENLRDLAKKNYYDISEMLNSCNELYFYNKSVYESTEDSVYLGKAFDALALSINLRDKFRTSFHDKDDRSRIAADIVLPVSRAINLIHKSGTKHQKEEIFSFVEQNKSILLNDATKAQQARTMGLPADLSNKEIALALKADKLRKKETEVKTEDEKAALAIEINNLNIETESLKKNLEQNFPKYYDLKYKFATATVNEIKKQIDEKTMFLEYFISDSLIFLFKITKNTYDIIPINISEQNLAKHADLLRKSITDYDFIKNEKENAYKTFTVEALWCYDNLISPALVNEKKIDHLIIVNDGVLNHIPFEIFLTLTPDNKTDYEELAYLIKDYKISYNYSATLWKENLEISNRGNGKIIAFAPVYEKEQKLNNNNRGELLRNLRYSLNDLPAARDEVGKLSKLFNGKFFIGESATEENFRKIAANYGIIHLAMHGILNQQTPILSSLAFTENGDSTEDNFLEAWEISHLKLNAQLVVLSACETGYGKFQQGEGVISLARAFMYAGVPSLVVSLWQVNDASTAEIMQLFYANLAKGMDKAEALRQAKLKYIAECKNPMMAHPAFWAAFVQIGDSRPVKIATKGGGNWYLLVGIGLFGLFGVIFALRQKKKIRF